MKDTEARDLLARFFAAFPMYRNWFNRLPDRDTTADLWIANISRWDLADAEAVIEAMIAGELPLPEGYELDRLPQYVARECRLRVNDRSKAKHRDELHRIATEGRSLSKMQRTAIAIKESNRAGELFRSAQITEEQNEAYVRGLQDWADERTNEVPILTTEERAS